MTPALAKVPFDRAVKSLNGLQIFMSESSKPVALIIGGSSGIGLALAKKLSALDWRLTITGRDAAKLQEAADALEANSALLDARDSTAVNELFDSVAKNFSRVDAVANCAGSMLLKPAHLTSDEEFSETIAQNLTTAFNVTRAAARTMMKQTGGGSVVLCSSVAARRGLVNHEAIAAAKSGVEGLALAAAASYARLGIRFNAVAPALTRTNLTRSLTQNETLLKISAAMHPLGRIGEPDEVASAMTWLLDPAQSWVTGQVIGVDGGLGSVQARA
jgi:3-oxoacyl-[acyl-carrier protein] reductase